VIQAHIEPRQATYGATYLVADSTLYSEPNLDTLAQTAIKWITLVPATVRDAQGALAQADPPAMVPLQEGYRYHALPSAYGGLEQHWVLIYSEARQALSACAQDLQATFLATSTVRLSRPPRWRPLMLSLGRVTRCHKG
jgi:transposase